MTKIVGQPEALERRQLLSVAPLLTPDERRAVAELAATPAPATSGSHAARSLVVIDASASADGRLAGSFADAAATLVVGAADDVFARVGDALAGLGGASAIHLVSHGSPGRFTLGNTLFDSATVDDLGPSLVAWNRLAGPGSDLYLWGCDIAGGDGASLVDSIHALSGFDVAASIDVTGPAALGGDFDLEYAAGDVAAPALVAGVDMLWDTTLAAAITASSGKTAHAVLGGATVVDAAITATGVTAAEVTVTIGNTDAVPGDKLAVPATLTAAGVTTAYTATFDATTLALTIKATTGTFTNAEIQSLFRAVTFTGGAAHKTGDVGITFAAGAATATKTVAVTAYTLSETQRTNLAAAFTTIEAQIAEKIKSQTTAGQDNPTDVPFTGRTVSDLFYPTTGDTNEDGTPKRDLTKAIQPYRIGELLKLGTTATTTLGKDTATPADLVSDLATQITSVATAPRVTRPLTGAVLFDGMNASTTAIDVVAGTVEESGTVKSLTFTLDVLAMRGSNAKLDLDKVAEDLGIKLLSPPDVTVGGGVRYKMTVSLDVATDVVTVSFDPMKTGGFGGVTLKDVDADVTIGMIGGQLVKASGSAGVLLPLDFGGKPSQTVAKWATTEVKAFGTATGTADFTLPISAKIGTTTVTTDKTQVVVADTDIFDDTPATYTTTDFDTVRWFAGITPERVIQQILDVGGVYGALRKSGSDVLGVTVPFVADTSLGDLFDFKSLFDAQIGKKIDVYEPILNTAGRDELIDWKLPLSDDETPKQSFYSDLRGGFSFGIVVNEIYPVYTVSVAGRMDRNTLADLVSDINAALDTLQADKDSGITAEKGIGITAAVVSNKIVFKATDIAVQSFAIVPAKADTNQLASTPVASNTLIKDLAPGLYTVTGKKTGTVTGTNFYTLDTELGAAAVHAGLLADGKTGVVRVGSTVKDGYAVGSTRNGIVSGTQSGTGLLAVVPVPVDVKLVSSGEVDLARLGVTPIGEPLAVLETADTAGITATLALRAQTGAASFRVGNGSSAGTVVTVDARTDPSGTVTQTLAAVNAALATAGVVANVQARLVKADGTVITGEPTGSARLQFYLRKADTKIDTSSGGRPVTDTTINVASTAGFPSAGTIRVATSSGTRDVTYTGTTATSFTGCAPTGTPTGAPTLTSGGSVSFVNTWTKLAIAPESDILAGKVVELGFLVGDIASRPRPAALRTFDDFTNTAIFPADKITITPVYTAPNGSTPGSVTMQFSATGTSTVSRSADIAFKTSPLGAVKFASASNISLAPTYGLNFGVRFGIGPSSPAVLVAGAAPVSTGVLTADATFALDLVMQDRYAVEVKKDWTTGNTTAQDLVSDINRALSAAKASDGTTKDLVAADRLVARYGQFSGRIELVTASRANGGAAVTIDAAKLRGNLTAPLSVSFTYAGRTWTVTVPAAKADATTTDTLQSRIGQLNAALANATPDIGAGESLYDRVFFTTRSKIESGKEVVEVLLASVDPPAEAWPATVRLTAARDGTAVKELGFSDGGSAATSEIVARASGVSAAITKFVDDKNVEQPFATGTLQATLPSLSGSTMLGFNTINFGGSEKGSIDAKIALALPVAVTASAAVSDLAGSFTRTLTKADGTGTATAGITLTSLSADKPFPTVAGQDPPTVTITVPDLSAISVLVDQPLGVPIPVPFQSVANDGFTLTQAATINFIANSATYSVTVTPEQTTGTSANTSFADLVDDFNASLAAATGSGGTTIRRGQTTVAAGDLSNEFVIKDVGGRMQVFARVPAANPDYGVTNLLPNLGAFGEIGLQGSFGVSTVADALADALGVFNTLRFDVAATATTTLPLLTQPLAELIRLDTGLARRIDALRSANVSNPAGLEPAIMRALGLTSDMVNVAFDNDRSAYRVDISYDSGAAVSRNLNLDLEPFFAMLGQKMPEGLGILNDGGGSSPLSIVLGGTSVLSVGIDLSDPTKPRTFLYGHDGGDTYGLDDGTSFEITFRVEGKNIAFTAGVGAFGVFIREGTARIGGELVTVAGKNQVTGDAALRIALTDGTAGSKPFYVAPTLTERAALAAQNYVATFSGVADVSLPLFAPTEFTPLPNTPDPRVVLSINDLGKYVTASAPDGDRTGIGNVLTVNVPDVQAAVQGSAPKLFDLLRDPALFLDGIDVFLGTVETALRGLSEVPVPVIGTALGDAASGVFGWRRGWLRDMKAQMRGAGESVFEVARQGIFDNLGGAGLGILLENNGDRTVAGMVEASSIDAVTLTFVDDAGVPLEGNTYGAHGVEFRMRLGQQLFDTGVNLGFTFDALAPLFDLSLAGGLRLQLGWDMTIGFGFNVDDGFYVIVDPLQPEAQLRFDAFLDTASRDYTAAYRDEVWVVVDGAGNVVDDPVTKKAMRAIAVDKDGKDVTSTVPLPGTGTDDCGCGDQADKPIAERTWWVVAAQNSAKAWVPGTIDQWGRLVPATGTGEDLVDSLVEITAVAPLQLRGDLFFLTLKATDKVRFGLRGVTEYDSRYTWGALGKDKKPVFPIAPQVDAETRDNAVTGINRNNELPTLFSGTIGVNVTDPSAAAAFNTAVRASTITDYALADKTGKIIYAPGKATPTPVREFLEVRVLDLASAKGDANGLTIGRPLAGTDPILVAKDRASANLAAPLIVPVTINGTSWLFRIKDGTDVSTSRKLADALIAARGTAVIDADRNGKIDPDKEQPNPALMTQVSFGFVAGPDGNAKDTAPIWWIIEPPAGSTGSGTTPAPTVDDWTPLRRMKDDPSKNRVTFDELRVGGFGLMSIDMVARAVVNLELDLSIADSAAIPRVLADLNLDWSSNFRQPVAGGPGTGTTTVSTGIDPKAGTTKLDLLPEVGLSNIRLDVGSFLTGVIKPIVDELDDSFKPLDPLLDVLQTRIPVLSDIAGRKIEITDLLAAFGGPKGKAAATLIDTVIAVRSLISVLGSVPAGVSLELPMGRFWLPKQEQNGRYAYGEMLYDNEKLGLESGDFASNPLEDAGNVAAAKNALDKLEAQSADNPDYKQPGVDAKKRGGFRFPILQDPVNVFKLLMGRDAVLVTYSLPEVDLSVEASIPLVRILVLEVGLRFQLDVKAQMHFGYDTYGIRMFVDSGDVGDLFHGFYISDRAKADGSGADVDELTVEATIALYGGVDVVLARAGIEGGFTFTGTVNLNDPNNDGKLRFTEIVGLIDYTGNPLDIVDITMRGEVYARYYYWVGLRVWTPWKTYTITLARGGKTFARMNLFTLVFEGSDGPPAYASTITSIDKAGVKRPGTLLIHAGTNAPKRVSNQDPLKTKDGAERFKIWNKDGTVYVRYLNYSDSETQEFEGVSRILFDGGVGDDVLDASELRGLPIEFYGGLGDDEVIVGSGSDTKESILDGGAGIDTIEVRGGGRFKIFGGLGDDEIDAGTGIVTVDGGGGADAIKTGDGSTSTLVFDGQYGGDTLDLSAAALVNLLDFTESSSGVTALLAGVGSTVSAGAGNVVTFNLAAATEIRGSQQRDRFAVTNPSTRAANGGRGLVLRGGIGDDTYEIVADTVTGVAGDGITIDDILPPTTVATAGKVTLSDGDCGHICKIAVKDAGLGYTVAPDVVIVDATGSGARAVASLDEQGRVAGIIVTRQGSGYSANAKVYLVNPTSYSDKLVFNSTATAATLDRGGNVAEGKTTGDYRIAVGGKDFKFVGWTTVGTPRPEEFDTSEIDSVTVNLPKGVLTLAAGIDLFDTFTVAAHRMEQNARIVADTVSLTTDNGFQVRYAIDAVNNGDVTIRSTGKLDDYSASWASAIASVTGSAIGSVNVDNAGGNYWFAPSITFAGGGGTGARAQATVADGKLTGITVIGGGTGYFQSPRPQVVIAPAASIQVDAMITSTNPGSGVGYGDGRGRVLLYADKGSVVTSGETFFPFDTRQSASKTARTIDWLDGDFRYRSTVALDDLVNDKIHPGISVGTGAEFTAVLDADGRVVGFNVVKDKDGNELRGSGYSFDLPPSVDIEGLATAVAIVATDGTIAGLRITYPGEGYGAAPKVTIRPNGFGRIVDFDVTKPVLTADGVPLNRVHIQAAGGRLVVVAGNQIGDPTKPLKSDVETFVAQTIRAGGSISLLEKDALRIGRDLAIDGLITNDGNVAVTTFGGALELGAPVQRVDGQGRLLWQDDAKTIPIYERDANGDIVYEGGQIRVGDGSVKLTADDIEVNVPLNAGLLASTGREIILQPVKVDADVGLSGTRARVEALMATGGISGFTNVWGGRGYVTAPTVVVAPPGERAFGTATVLNGAVQAVEVVFGGTNYTTAPVVTLIGGGIGGVTPANPAKVTAVVGADGSIIGFTVDPDHPGSGYVSTPRVDVALPGQQARVRAVLATVQDPVSKRYAVDRFEVIQAGTNYRVAPKIEVAAPYDFTLDGDEIAQFDEAFETVVIGRIEGQHLFHSPKADLGSGVVLRAPRAGGKLDMNSLTAVGPVSIVGSGNTFHLDTTGAEVSGSSISIEDNVIVHAGVSGVITATTGAILVSGPDKGMIDGEPAGDNGDENEDLLLAAETTVTVDGAIGSKDRLDDLTITSATRGAIKLGASVSLTGDLRVTGGALTIGGIIDVDGTMIIDASSAVLFSNDVTVDGNLEIVGASDVTFAGRLTVLGTFTIRTVSGAVRFEGLVDARGTVSVSAGRLVEVLDGFVAGGDATFTSDEVNLNGGQATVAGVAAGTLRLEPSTAGRAIRVGSPTGSPTNTLDVSDADLAAIARGWKEVVIGDLDSGTGAVTVGTIGSKQDLRNSWLANATTIVGGSVTVDGKVDVAATAASLRLLARTGDVTVNKAINETATERNPWVRLESLVGAVAIKAPVWSTATVSLDSATTTSQTATAPIATSALKVTSGGAVTLDAAGNAFDLLAVVTSNDDIAIREDSGYEIGFIDGVIGIQVGTGTARLISGGLVTQAYAIDAERLNLQGAGGRWILTADNTIGTLTADTGSVALRDAGSLKVGVVTASATSGIAVDLSAPLGIELSADVTTGGGDAAFRHAIKLATDVAIKLASGGKTGTATFLTTVDGTTSGQEALSITGKLDAAASLGEATALKSLSVSGDATLAGGITVRTVGDQTFYGKATSAGTVTVQAGSGATVKFLGDTTLGGLVTRTTDTADYSVELTGSEVTITDAVAFTNTGAVTLGDGATDDLWFKAGVESKRPSGTSLGGTIRTTNAAATFGQKTPANHAITLLADTTVSTGSGAATFWGTVDGAKRLVVNASGDTTFSSAVGGTTALAHVETDAPGRTLLDGGSVRTASPTSQVYNDDVVLGADTTLDAGTGAVTFAKTLNGSRTLTVNTSGVTTFGGTVGNATPLVSLATDKGGTTRINGGSVTTTGTAGQVYGDAVEIGVQNATLSAGIGLVTFDGTVDSAADAARGLTVTAGGLTTFKGAVGATKALANLTVDGTGTTAIDGGSVTTSGSGGQIYKDAVTLGKATVLSATGTGPVTFEKTLTGAYALTVTAAGDTTFGDSVSLESLLTDGTGTTAINGGSVTTTGSGGQVYKDAVTLGKATVLSATNTGPVTFEKTLTGDVALTVTAAGLTTFGDTVSLESLLTDGSGTTAIDGGSVTTSGSAGQVYKDAVTLGKATVLSATNTGPVTFEKTLTGAVALTVTAAGTTTFGNSVSLASLLTDGDGTTAIDGGSITTSGSAGQVYKDAVTLGKATVLSDTGTGPVTFEKTLTGAVALTVTAAGTTTFGDSVSLASLLTDGTGTTAIDGGSITTSGSAGQVYKDAVTLGKATVLSATGTGPVTFEKTLTGAVALTVTAAGTTTFGDAVSLASLLTNGGGKTAINATTITTTDFAGQVYNDAVTLGAAVTLTAANAGAIMFAGTLDGPGSLTANTQGATTFTGAVGGTTALASLTTDAGGTTKVNGSSVRTTGNQSWLDDVEMPSATRFEATAGAIGGGTLNTFRASGQSVSFVAATGVGTAAVPIRIAAAEVTATTASGDIHLVGVGDLVVGSSGLIATTGRIGLDASGKISVPTGGRIAGGAVPGSGVAATKPIQWSVITATNNASGSLSRVVENANRTGVEGRATFDTLPRNTVLPVTAPLAVTTRLTIDGGTSGVVIDGGALAKTGFLFNARAAGSQLAGVTLRNFNDNAIVLDASPGVAISGCVIQANGNGIRASGNQAGSSIVRNTFAANRAYGIHLYAATGLTIDGNTASGLNTLTSMGLYATGTLKNTVVVNNIFRGGLRGALLQNARSLVFGRLGQGNMLSDNLSVPSQPIFAGTGIRAEGDMTGTTVTGNTFARNNYGFGFVGARGLRLNGNTFVRNSIAGIHVDGDNTGSSLGTGKDANTFGTGANANKANIVRARGSRGI